MSTLTSFSTPMHASSVELPGQTMDGPSYAVRYDWPTSVALAVVLIVLAEAAALTGCAMAAALPMVAAALFIWRTIDRRIVFQLDDRGLLRRGALTPWYRVQRVVLQRRWLTWWLTLELEGGGRSTFNVSGLDSTPQLIAALVRRQIGRKNA